MHTNLHLREALLRQGDAAFAELNTQLEHLYKQVTFYLDRYPQITKGDEMRTIELSGTIEILERLPAQLGLVLGGLRQGTPRVISRLGVELHILNEIWANIQVLCAFLLSNDIDLEPFDQDRAALAFANLVRVNRVLP
jgi:hypothetical protein